MPMFRGDFARCWGTDGIGRLWFAKVGRWDNVVLPRLVSIVGVTVPGHDEGR